MGKLSIADMLFSYTMWFRFIMYGVGLAFMVFAFHCPLLYFWLDPKVAKDQGCNRRLTLTTFVKS